MADVAVESSMAGVPETAPNGAPPRAGRGRRRRGRGRRPNGAAAPTSGEETQATSGGVGDDPIEATAAAGGRRRAPRRRRARHSPTAAEDGAPKAPNREVSGLPADLADCEVVKVSESSRPRGVAKAIAGLNRDKGKDVAVCAIGAGSINQALKSLIWAREEMMEQDKADFEINVMRTSEAARDGIAFHCIKIAEPAHEKNAEEPMRVSSRTIPGKMAGALANRIREKQAPVLHAVGRVSVMLAVKSAMLATRYLEEDNIKLHIRPSYEEAQLKEGPGVIVRLDLAPSHP